MVHFLISKLNQNAIIPVRATGGSAGYDLTSCEEKTIPAHGWVCVDTGIAIQIASDCYCRIAPRSGLTVKNGLCVGAGVIDSDYRGAIGVVLFNHGDTDFQVKIGMKIAQMVFEKIYTPDFEEVEYSELTTTLRGEDGFGSTGV